MAFSRATNSSYAIIGGMSAIWIRHVGSPGGVASHRCKSIAVRVTRGGCLDFFRKLQAHRIDRIIIELNLLPSYSPSAPRSARSQSRSRSKYTSFARRREYAFGAYVRGNIAPVGGTRSTVSGTNDDHVTASRHGFRRNAVVSVDYTSERSSEERERGRETLSIC